MAKPKNVTIYNAPIRWRNFTGRQAEFNNEGNRNFVVLIDPIIADQMTRDGWNIRWLEPKDPSEDRQASIRVAVRFDTVPPKIVIVNSLSGKKSVLDETNCGLIDWAEIENVDLTLTPYEYNYRGKTGIKAYLKSIYVTIVEDELETKYYDVGGAATEIVGGCGNCEECDGSCGCAHNAVQD